MQNTTHPIRTLQLSFNHEIYARQIPNWRGAFIEMAGLNNDLFHNHDGQHRFHYRYPLIQYRMYKGKACIFAINEGVDAIQKALSENEWEIRWEDQKKSLSVEDMRMNEHYLRMLSKPKQYKLFKWIALNEENYTKWLKAKNMIERVQLLQSTLYGHIKRFCSAMQFEFSEPLEVNIQNIQMMEQVKCHKVSLLAFNIAYDCNVLLPNGIALGKSVSHGFGWQMPRRVPKKGNSRRRNVNFMPEPDVS